MLAITVAEMLADSIAPASVKTPVEAENHARAAVTKAQPENSEAKLAAASAALALAETDTAGVVDRVATTAANSATLAERD